MWSKENKGKVAEAHGGRGHESVASTDITQEMHNHVRTLNNREALRYLANN